MPLIRCNALPHPRFLNIHLATVTRKIPLIRCSALLHPQFLTGQMRMTKYWGCGMNLWYMHMRAHTHTNTHTHGHTTTHTGSHSWIWTHTRLSLRKLFFPLRKLCFLFWKAVTVGWHTDDFLRVCPSTGPAAVRAACVASKFSGLVSSSRPHRLVASLSLSASLWGCEENSTIRFAKKVEIHRLAASLCWTASLWGCEENSTIRVATKRSPPQVLETFETFTFYGHKYQVHLLSSTPGIKIVCQFLARVFVFFAFLSC